MSAVPWVLMSTPDGVTGTVAASIQTRKDGWRCKPITYEFSLKGWGMDPKRLTAAPRP